jgi:hypothetical protein
MAVPILPPCREFQPIRTFMSFSLLRLRESPSLEQEMAAARRPNELPKTEKTKDNSHATTDEIVDVISLEAVSLPYSVDVLAN